jgi:hypothetical protein
MKEDTMRKILLALLVAALALTAAACSGGDDDSGEAEGDMGAAAADTAVAEAEGGGEAEPAAQRSGGGGSLPSVGPRVIQTASLSLSVRPNEFRRTVDRARTVALGLGGFVVSSSASQGPDRRLVAGTLVVRVPEPSYAQAIERLSDLGRVEAREESGQDVSQELVDLGARARHLEAVERQLLELLERADTVAAALAVQSQLNEVQLELEQARGRLRFLDDQVAYATISLDVHERQVVVAGDGGGWGIVDAWRTAGRGFVTVVGWIFVAAATIAPLLVLLALLYVAARLAARRGPLFRRSGERPSA